MINLALEPYHTKEELQILIVLQEVRYRWSLEVTLKVNFEYLLKAAASAAVVLQLRCGGDGVRRSGRLSF